MFQAIEQDGGVQQVATPYDARLAELSARVDGTAVIVTSNQAQSTKPRRVAEKAITTLGL